MDGGPPPPGLPPAPLPLGGPEGFFCALDHASKAARSRHTDQVESESGRPFGTVNLASHGGANVFIRLAKKHRMSADHDSLGMSLQRSFLRAATAAGGSRPGTPPSSSSLATTQLAAAALSRIADRAEGRDDASLMLLWASYPRIFFYNLVRCSFYRNRIYEWMKGKVSHLKKRNVDMVFFASE